MFAKDQSVILTIRNQEFADRKVQRFCELDLQDTKAMFLMSGLEIGSIFFCDERCMNEWLNIHMVQLVSYVGLKTKPSETPIDITQEQLTNWSGEKYTRSTIRFLSEPDIENNVLT